MEAYRRRPSENTVWFRYDDSDNWVVQSPSSAQTHLFTASAHCLWTLIPEGESRPTTELIAALSMELGREVDDRFVRSMRELLGFMDSAGLIEPAAP